MSTEREPRPSIRDKQRAARDLRALTEALAVLPRALLAKVDLPPRLREALDHAPTVTSHVARRRHLKHVAALLRMVDDELLDELRELVEHGDRRGQVRTHQAERWRDRLLGEDGQELTRFVEEHPGVDAQRLRQLVRQARREGDQRRAVRALFEVIRDAL